MTEYQNRRLSQLTELLINHKIQKWEFTEYQYLSKLLRSKVLLNG
jgi:hypothetical protein